MIIKKKRQTRESHSFLFVYMLCIDKNEKVYASGARCFIQNKKNKRERERERSNYVIVNGDPMSTIHR